MAEANKTGELSELEKQQLMALGEDDLEDLPEYVNPPDGTYVFKMGKRQMKKVGENKAITIDWTVQGVVELADPATPESELPKLNDVMSLMFNMDNEFGRGNYKKVVTALKASHGLNGTADIFAAPDDTVTVQMTVRRTEQKKNNVVKLFSNLVSIVGVAG